VLSTLAVFAHPDDESLAAGGLLARSAAAGGRTAVVTATWAEDSARAGELAVALEILGAGPPRMPGYADARVPESAPGCPRFLDAPLDEAIGRLVAHLRDFRPDVVVTHDAYGGLTGHPDHVHTHRVTVLALEAAGLEQLYPEAGTAWRPRTLSLATHPPRPSPHCVASSASARRRTRCPTRTSPPAST
jgi:N-acetyl-1-D-myo-inositol-2-amino-2-deoxy-alpha-D-glucopyranoside deacetylase